MARNPEVAEVPDRMIRDRARSSPTLQALTDAGERGWWRLIPGADDYGRFDADPEVLLARLFERRPTGWSVRRMATVIAEWEAVGLVHRYVNGDHRTLGHVLRWAEYQRQRDSKPKYPDPPCQSGSLDACAKSRANHDLPQVAADGGDSPLARARAPIPTSASDADADCRQPGASAWPTPAALVRLYNDLSPDECPSVATLSPERTRKAREFLRAFPEEAWWREVFAQMRRAPFLRGLVRPKDGRKPFVADFDWLLARGQDRVENAVKVHDGRYQDG